MKKDVLKLVACSVVFSMTIPSLKALASTEQEKLKGKVEIVSTNNGAKDKLTELQVNKKSQLISINVIDKNRIKINYNNSLSVLPKYEVYHLDEKGNKIIDSVNKISVDQKDKKVFYVETFNDLKTDTIYNLNITEGKDSENLDLNLHNLLFCYSKVNSDYIAVIHLIEADKIQIYRTAGTTIKPELIILKQLDDNGKESGDNLVHLSTLPISYDTNSYTIDLNKKLLKDKNYKLNIGKEKEFIFNGKLLYTDEKNNKETGKNNSAGLRIDAKCIDNRTITVSFNKLLDESSASNIKNYVINNNNMEILLAKYDSETKSVTLTTKNQMKHGKSYSVTTGEIIDAAGNKLPKCKKNFVYDKNKK